MGKILDVPVYQLLGGKQRDKIPCFATTGGGSFEEVLTNCRKLWIWAGMFCVSVAHPDGRTTNQTPTSHVIRLVPRRSGSSGCARNLGPIQFLASTITTNCLLLRRRHSVSDYPRGRSISSRSLFGMRVLRHMSPCARWWTFLSPLARSLPVSGNSSPRDWHRICRPAHDRRWCRGSPCRKNSHRRAAARLDAVHHGPRRRRAPPDRRAFRKCA